MYLTGMHGDNLTFIWLIQVVNTSTVRQHLVCFYMCSIRGWFLGTDTNITIQMYCQSRNVIIYCKGRILTPWSSTSWKLTVAQLVKSIPPHPGISHPPTLLLEEECSLYTFTYGQVFQVVTSPKHCSTKISHEHFTAPSAHSEHKTILVNLILTL
jgi:hypothetical protein